MKRLLIACCFAATPLVMNAQKTAAPLPITVGTDIAIVPTEQGKVRGYIHNGTYIYKGIPYAQAKRFQPPTKPASWDGIRSSLSYGPV
ncbi:MAG TPA: carboxylesterase family protein, partial [Chryseolinea sp.]